MVSVPDFGCLEAVAPFFLDNWTLEGFTVSPLLHEGTFRPSQICTEPQTLL